MSEYFTKIFFPNKVKVAHSELQFLQLSLKPHVADSILHIDCAY